ncbi:ATP-binding protein [Lysinibacillus mangiferihumi]|uniref:ATP-binding protein n=1 Tax=Lysinibacillus mangiferihumi TaxID=1130819 RepID=UPI002286962B
MSKILFYLSLPIRVGSNRLESLLKHYTKYMLLIIDEMGYLPSDIEDAKLFFKLIDRHYEKRSTIFTININFKYWDEAFQEHELAKCNFRSLLHHGIVITIVGNLYSLKNHLAPKGE